MTLAPSPRLKPETTHPAVDARRAVTQNRQRFVMGSARNPSGAELAVDGISLLRDGERWLPVMGEFHFSRYPRSEWRDELLKIKAGGVDILATYIFWIHHEEIEGRFDWSGQRDLRHFVELCAEAGLYVVARVGPWCHGEVRNGALPEWLLHLGDRLRTDDAEYLAKARVFYDQIARQLRGLLWRDGGPVVGVQIDNEYHGPAQHLLTLKELAVACGLDVPLYTRTGWPELTTSMPFGHLLPLHGGYAEGFWDRVLDPMPGEYWNNFIFAPARADAAIATDHFGQRKAHDEERAQDYPYLTCELGGGMMNSYHRRIRIAPEDILAVAICKVGSGSNLPGYYMYHGGINPEGERTTLSEAQATRHTNHNDLPVKAYDFQAPLGSFGQSRRHYHLLRKLHLFLRDFGDRLAEMPATLPTQRPSERDDTSTLRWAVRSEGDAGFVFVSNYQRLQPMPAHEAVRFDIATSGGTLRLPSQPVTIPSDASFFWPFNIDLGGVVLHYATAQPMCRVNAGDRTCWIFAATPDVAPEFTFLAGDDLVHAESWTVPNRDTRRVRIQNPGLGEAVGLRSADGCRHSVVVLDEREALGCWKVDLAGRDRVLVTGADVLASESTLALIDTRSSGVSVAMLPAPQRVTLDGAVLPGTEDGLFTRFELPPRPRQSVDARLEQLREPGAPRAVVPGAAGVAAAPTEADFEHAGVWQIHLPDGVPDRELVLRLSYVGDVARVYLGDKLLVDDFWNGADLELGLLRYAPQIYQQPLILKVLPTPQGRPIYFSDPAIRANPPAEGACEASVELVERHRWTLEIG